MCMEAGSQDPLCIGGHLSAQFSFLATPKAYGNSRARDQIQAAASAYPTAVDNAESFLFIYLFGHTHHTWKLQGRGSH